MIVSTHYFQDLYSLVVQQMLIYYHSLSNCFLMSFSCGMYLQAKYPQLLWSDYVCKPPITDWLEMYQHNNISVCEVYNCSFVCLDCRKKSWVFPCFSHQHFTAISKWISFLLPMGKEKGINQIASNATVSLQYTRNKTIYWILTFYFPSPPPPLYLLAGIHRNTCTQIFALINLRISVVDGD